MVPPLAFFSDNLCRVLPSPDLVMLPLILSFPAMNLFSTAISGTHQDSLTVPSKEAGWRNTSPEALRNMCDAISSLTEEDTGKGPSSRKADQRFLHWPSWPHPKKCIAWVCHADCAWPSYTAISRDVHSPGPPLEVGWKDTGYMSPAHLSPPHQLSPGQSSQTNIKGDLPWPCTQPLPGKGVCLYSSLNKHKPILRFSEP